MTKPVDFRNAASVIELFGQAGQTLRQSPFRQHCTVRLPARGRLLATGDLHDNPIHFQKIVQLARLEHSPDHHVVLHEMIHSERLVNNLDFSHRMLINVAQLVLAFPAQVHPLLANHELAQFTGKGVSKGAGNSVEKFNDGLSFVFGDDWESVLDAIREFTAAMALALIGGPDGAAVMCAHSLPAPRMMHVFDRDVLDRDLRPADYQPPHGAAHLMVWGRAHTSQQVEELAASWGVRLFCLGHEHAEVGIEMKNPNLIVLNSDHEQGVALPLDLANIPSAEESLLHAVPLRALGGV